MKIPIMFSIDNKVISEFQNRVERGDRSRIVEELLRDYLSLFGEKKNTDRFALEKKEYEEKLEKIYALEEAEREKERKEEEEKEKKVIAVAESQKQNKIIEDCKFRARQMALSELDIDAEKIKDYYWRKENEKLYTVFLSRWREIFDIEVKKEETKKKNRKGFFL